MMGPTRAAALPICTMDVYSMAAAHVEAKMAAQMGGAGELEAVEFNCRIPSSLEELDLLHQVSGGWVPSSASIRPGPSTRQKKADHMEACNRLYVSECDYILDNIFELDTHDSGGKFAVCRQQLDGMRRHIFLPNEFAYATPDGTNHWVMWYSY